MEVWQTASGIPMRRFGKAVSSDPPASRAQISRATRGPRTRPEQRADCHQIPRIRPVVKQEHKPKKQKVRLPSGPGVTSFVTILGNSKIDWSAMTYSPNRRTFLIAGGLSALASTK